MPIEHYKGLEICIMYNDNQKPYYIVCKEFKKDPFWEIGTTEYSTVKKAKEDINNKVYE